MNIVGVESLVYGSEDVDAATRFHEDWGLELVEKSASGADFALPDKTTVHVRGIGDPALPPASVPGSTVREVIWGVEDAASMQAIGAGLSRDREVTGDPGGTLHSVDDLGYRIGFRLSARTPAPVSLPVTNTAWNAPRVNRRAEIFERGPPRQQRIFHVVYWAPGDAESHARFYQERLGFRLTESIAGLGHFMRASRSHDHHNLFLQNKGNTYGFQHVAYEAQDFDEVLRCGSLMEDRGWKSHYGPGRHYFGSGWFWYFDNPAGGLAETGVDSDYIGDDWQPLTHDEVPPEAARPWTLRKEEAELGPGHGNWPQLVDGKVEAAAGD